MLNCDECDTQLVVYMCSLLLRASLHEVSLIVMLSYVSPLTESYVMD